MVIILENYFKIEGRFMSLVSLWSINLWRELVIYLRLNSRQVPEQRAKPWSFVLKSSYVPTMCWATSLRFDVVSLRCSLKILGISFVFSFIEYD